MFHRRPQVERRSREPEASPDVFGERTGSESNWGDFTPLWDDVAAITVPTMMVQGGDSVFVLPAWAVRLRS